MKVPIESEAWVGPDRNRKIWMTGLSGRAEPGEGLSEYDTRAMCLFVLKDLKSQMDKGLIPDNEVWRSILIISRESPRSFSGHAIRNPQPDEAS